MQALLKGRIESSEVYNNQVYTVVTEPAIDSYSSPQRFKVKSEAQLGAVGAEITLQVTLRGNVRQKTYTDKQTGQVKQFNEDNVYLDAVIAQQQPQKKVS